MDSSRSSSVLRKRQTSGDTYCGADRGMFRWCQTISDLDVIILLSSSIKSASDIKVDVTAESIHVQIKISKNQWYTVMEDTFNDKVKSNDVVWTFEPGKLSIHLEKARDKWWDSFLSKEPKINLQELELTRPVSDLTQEEEMTLQKLWNDQLTKICQLERYQTYSSQRFPYYCYRIRRRLEDSSNERNRWPRPIVSQRNLFGADMRNSPPSETGHHDSSAVSPPISLYNI